MSKYDFWELIGEAKTLCKRDMDAYASWLKEQLIELGPQKARDFHDFVHAYQDLANQYGLWSAASILCNGCTDDGFIDFRAWLVAQGRKVYLAALNDPDSLADVEPYGGCQFEDLAYIGSVALEELTGQDAYENTDRAAYNSLRSELEQDIVYGEGLGYPYDPNEIAQRFPRLCARFLPPEKLSAMIEHGSTWNPNSREIKAARAAGPKNAALCRPWADTAGQQETPKLITRQDVERRIAAMKAETFREIQKDSVSPAGKLAWYWSYLGSLDMAQELGLITDDRRQAFYHEALSHKPDCVVTDKNLEQQPEESRVEKCIAEVKAKTFQGIHDDLDFPEGQLAWYWSYLGSLDMAQELGLISDERRQALYREAESHKPDCVVTSKDLEQPDTAATELEIGGIKL